MRDSREIKVFYKGRQMPLAEAGPLLVRQIIEDVIPTIEEFDTGMCPYEWIANRFVKHTGTVRKWTYLWDRKNGAHPTLDDFLKLARITGSELFVEFMQAVTGTVDQKETEYSVFVESIADKMDLFANQMRDAAASFKKPVKANIKKLGGNN